MLWLPEGSLNRRWFSAVHLYLVTYMEVEDWFTGVRTEAGSFILVGIVLHYWEYESKPCFSFSFSEFSVYHVTRMFPLLACQLGNKQFDMYRIGNLYIFDSTIWRNSELKSWLPYRQVEVCQSLCLFEPGLPVCFPKLGCLSNSTPHDGDYTELSKIVQAFLCLIVESKKETDEEDRRVESFDWNNMESHFSRTPYTMPGRNFYCQDLPSVFVSSQWWK